MENEAGKGIVGGAHIGYYRNHASGTEDMSIADPQRYGAAVRQFQRHFGLADVSPVMSSLVRLLSRFSRLPYENISKIIKYRRYFEGVEKIRLPPEVMEEHAAHSLGGTCFSLTYFLHTILVHHGFACYPVMADMRSGNNVHCALVVLLERKKLLVDPGYLLSRPMEIPRNSSRIYRTEFSGVQLAFDPQDQRHHLYTFDRDEVKWRYRFRDEAVTNEAFLKHWLASFTWNSMHGLCLTKVEKDRMIYIHKTFMRETGYGGKKNVNIKNDVHGTIQRIFSIDPALIEEAEAAMDENMERERRLGLWVPKKTWKPGS